MTTWLQLLDQMHEEGDLDNLALSPNPQFGSEDRPMLFARYLPEKLCPQNSFTEDSIRFRTQRALATSRYAPAPMRQPGMLMGSLNITLGSNKEANQLTGADHDALLALLNRKADYQALSTVIRWADRTLLMPHLQNNEAERAEAIAAGYVARRGINGFEDPVPYFQPEGHRITIPGGTEANPAGWYDPNYDILSDILGIKETMNDKGYSVDAMICLGNLSSTIRLNEDMVRRAGGVIIVDGTLSNVTSGRASVRAMNEVFADEELPSLMVYNNGYSSDTGYKRYLDCSPDGDRDYFVLIGRTEIDWDMRTTYASAVEQPINDDIYIGEAFELTGTLGYYGVGRPSGHTVSGRVLYTEAQMKSPTGYYGEAVQTGLPVIQEPEALGVIEVMRPTA